MSPRPDAWNPEDGPPPGDDERAEAARLADALDRGLAKGAAPELAARVDTALRVRATVRPHPDLDRAVVDRVIADVVDRRAARALAPVAFLRRRWRPLAVAAGLVAALGVGSRVGLREPPRVTSISRPADDVFTAPVGAGAGSTPTARLYDARMQSWRGVIYGPGRRR